MREKISDKNLYKKIREHLDKFARQYSQQLKEGMDDSTYEKFTRKAREIEKKTCKDKITLDECLEEWAKLHSEFGYIDSPDDYLEYHQKMTGNKKLTLSDIKKQKQNIKKIIQGIALKTDISINEWIEKTRPL